MVKRGGKGPEKGTLAVRLRVKNALRPFKKNQHARYFQKGISFPLQNTGEITGSGIMTERLTGYRWTEVIPLSFL